MEEPVVEFGDGKVRGVLREDLNGDKFCAYLGVPYGKPPIGDRRFKAPEPVDPWSGVRDCTKDGEKNIQVQPLICLDVEGSEDCLHLNVFTKKFPDDTSELKPVMVYLFGGRFRSGSSKSDLFGPDFLLSEDIVLVTPNCRVGLLGFLKLEDTSLDVPGNASLKDQNLALRWVQKNIKEFGGDPNNVTLVGHSSGGTAVHYHLLSPCSKGLFHKAIIMSGSVFFSWSERDDFSIRLLASVLDIREATEKEILEHLQRISAKDFIEAQEKYCAMLDERSLVIGPVVEKPNRTAFITKDPTDIILNGEFMKVPLLVSYTSHEGLIYDLMGRYSMETGGTAMKIPIEPNEFIPPIIRGRMDDEVFENICSEMEKTYSIYNSADKRCLMISDLQFTTGIIAAARTHAALSDAPVYLLRWSIEEELNFMKLACKSTDVPGTSHADELGYIFSRSLVPRPSKGSRPEKIIKKAVHLIRNFCYTGNPSLCKSDIVSKWQPLQIDKLHYLDFGNEITIKCCPEQKRMEFWQRILDLDKRDAKLSSLKVI